MPTVPPLGGVSALPQSTTTSRSRSADGAPSCAAAKITSSDWVLGAGPQRVRRTSDDRCTHTYFDVRITTRRHGDEGGCTPLTAGDAGLNASRPERGDDSRTIPKPD